MNKKQLGLRYMILPVFLLGIYLFVTAQQAGATASPWATWKLETVFPNNDIESVLIVQIGHTSPNGRRVIDKEKSYPVSCQTIGNPVIKNGTATFDGSSYFECSVPSIKEKVLEMTNGYMTIPDVCVSKRRPFIAGVVTIEDNPVNPNPNNPVFYLENVLGRGEIILATPLDVAAQQAALDVSFSQVEAASDSFALNLNPGTDQVITAVYERSGPTTFTPTFEVDGISLSATPATVNGPLRFSTLESTAYIGYSPALGEYFEGSVNSVLSDPYCEGKG